MSGTESQPTGFSVDLWRAIAAETGLKYRFKIYKTLPELLDGVRSGADAAGIAAISITAKREQEFEFSQPMYRSGLSIMVPAESRKLNVAGSLISWQMLNVILTFFLVLAVPAHLIWYLARGQDEGLPIAETYIPGIFDAIFWCAESMGGAAQGHPKRVWARLIALVWVYAGLGLIAYVTAYATTTLTMQSLRGDINGPKDLDGKRVAVVQGSTSAQYVADLDGHTVDAANFDAAVAAMLSGKADAVVYDTPVVLYRVKNEPRVNVAGAPFHPENYGIVFPNGSELRRPVNLALLKLIENGTYDSLYKKWFGDAE